jgi:hypothetical protein
VRDERKKTNNFDVTPEQQKAKESIVVSVAPIVIAPEMKIGKSGPFLISLDTFYFCGIPMDQKDDTIKEHLKKCNIPEPSSWDKHRVTDAFGFIHKYLKFSYSGENDADFKKKIQNVFENANSFLIQNQNILVIP